MKQIIFAFFIAFLNINAKGAELQKIIQDTQRLAQEPSRITIVWWIPIEFWDVVLRKNPGVTDDARVQFCKAMNEYLVFAVMSADVDPFGGISTKERAAIETNTELSIAGTIVTSLNTDTLSATARQFISIMKPSMANMLGQFGKGMEFLVYPNRCQKISALNPGSLSYTAFGNRFDWRLPIGSLLPPKIDEKTKQVFPGDYLYNPYTGERLSTTVAQPQGFANGSQPIRSEPQQPSSTADSKR